MSLISFQRSTLGAFVRSPLGARNNLQGFWLPFETTPEKLEISGSVISFAITDGAGYVAISHTNTHFPTKSTLISNDYGKTFTRKELSVAGSLFNSVPFAWFPIFWTHHSDTNTYELWTMHVPSSSGPSQTSLYVFIFDPATEIWTHETSKATGSYALKWDVKQIGSRLYSARIEIPGAVFINGVRLVANISSTRHDADFVSSPPLYIWALDRPPLTIPIETNGYELAYKYILSIFELNGEPYALIFVPVTGPEANATGLQTIVTLFRFSTNGLLGFIDFNHGWTTPTSQVGSTGFYFPIAVDPQVTDWSGNYYQTLVEISNTEYILFSCSTSAESVTFIRIVDGAFSLGVATFHNVPNGSYYQAPIRYWYDSINDLLFSVQTNYAVSNIIWVSRDRGNNWYPTSVKLVSTVGTQGYSQVIGVGNDRYIALGMYDNAAIYENTKNTIFSQVPVS